MPYLQIEDRQYPLLEGDTRVGWGDGSDIPLPSADGADQVVAIIFVATDSTTSVRRLSGAENITVNGVLLGTEPTPLFHGDRLEIGEARLVFGDEAHAGSTMQMALGMTMTEHDPAEDAGRQRARANGRLISLVDGREYQVPGSGLIIGREPGCDVVIAVGEVSRRHARIDLRADGYVLVDTSTNGILLNDTRVRGVQPLSQGDRIRIGPEEMRFHGDVDAPRAATAAPALPPPPPVPPERGEASAGSEWQTAPGRTASPPPATARPVASSPGLSALPPPRSPRQVLATLEIINEGPSKGTRFNIDSALAHVGRGPHNDVVIADESVSDSHAKIQRRDSGWYVVDMDSTNGTYVAGVRVQDEEPLQPNTDLRFGGVKLAFKIASSPLDQGSGTRVIVGYRPASETPLRTDIIDEDAERPAVRSGEKGVPLFLVIAVIALALVVVALILNAL